MRFSNVVIEVLGYAVAPVCWSSAEVERQLAPLYERLKLPYGRLELMTGIRERRFWEEGTRPSDASTRAGEHLFSRSSVARERIDAVVHCGVCRDRLEPATAAYVHRNLGLQPHTQFFDISNACLGVLNGLTFAAGLVESGQAKAVLVVSGENGFPLVRKTIEVLLARDWTRQEIKPFFANLTIGSGAVALLVCHRSIAPGGAALLGGVSEAATQYNTLCEGDSAGDGLEMLTDSEELLIAGIEVAQRTWVRFKEELGWSESTPDRVICHQVGSMHRLKLFETLGLDLVRDFSTFPLFGNMGSVSLPFTLARAVEEGAVKAGDRVALLGIGSGLSSMMLGMQWPDQ